MTEPPASALSLGFVSAILPELSLAEVLALLLSRDLLTAAGASVLGPDLASALDKIRGLLSPDALRLLDSMREGVGVRAAGAKLQQPPAELLAHIQRAMLEQRALRIRHYSIERDEVTPRTVDPYHLTYFNGGLYLLAYCRLRCLCTVEQEKSTAARPRNLPTARTVCPRNSIHFIDSRS